MLISVVNSTMRGKLYAISDGHQPMAYGYSLLRDMHEAYEQLID